MRCDNRRCKFYAMNATTIGEVVSQLDEIVLACRQQPSRNGCFAALYRNVTIDVAIRAYEQRRLGAWTSKVWARAFDCAELRQPLIIQHLLLGMNAHINLDLGNVSMHSRQ